MCFKLGVIVDEFAQQAGLPESYLVPCRGVGVRGGRSMWQPKHAGVIWLVLRGCLSVAGGIALLPATAGAQSNPIVIEDQQPGTNQWRANFFTTATDAGGQIKGYASATSVSKGHNITCYVSVNLRQTY